MKENTEAARDALGVIAAAVRGDGEGMGGIVFDGYLDGEQINVDDVAQLIQGLAFVGISWLHEKHTLERYLDQARKATGFNGPWPHVQDINSEKFVRRSCRRSRGSPLTRGFTRKSSGRGPRERPRGRESGRRGDERQASRSTVEPTRSVAGGPMAEHGRGRRAG
jgi:hypothetical protein